MPIRAHPLAANYRPSTFELQLLRVGTAGSLLTILNLYRPQWMSTPSTFCDELTDIIASLTSECTDDILVCGDANCPGPDDSSVHAELSEGLDSVGLTQLVTQPTRRLPGVANLLDILAASSVSRVTNVTVSEADFISDHCLLSAALAVRLPKPVVKYTWRNTRNINTTSFEDDLRKSVIFSQPATDVDAYVDQLDSVLTELLDKHAPVRTSHRRPPKKISRWLSDEAITAKRLRRRLERRWRSTGSDADRVNYRRACRDANRMINDSRRDHFRCRIESAGSDWKQRWRVVNELLHSRDTDKSRTDTENCDLSKSFAEYFVSKIDKLREAALGTLRRTPANLLSTLPNPIHTGPTVDSLQIVTSSEVSKLLHRSPPKSNCMDIIPTSLLLKCHESFCEVITHLANLSFTEGKFPSRFKTASVTPLLKNPSLDNTLPSNYRPISNLNFISKILERLFLQRIQPHILASPNYNRHQSAYRLDIPLRPLWYSCLTASITLLTMVKPLSFSPLFKCRIRHH